jgi:hypothetical protein
VSDRDLEILGRVLAWVAVICLASVALGLMATLALAVKALGQAL